jgi:hypothetical protein
VVGTGLVLNLVGVALYRNGARKAKAAV